MLVKFVHIYEHVFYSIHVRSTEKHESSLAFSAPFAPSCQLHNIWSHFWYHFLLKFRPNNKKSAAAAFEDFSALGPHPTPLHFYM